ncbi:acyl-CoA dehydrogenase family protein [Rhodococcus sp. NPDC056960]|uniref:acyl-CoA dehydrogenase family protein n=1 Tax=Rhodococcus sp. NPDC056960 TaxID=3345982 RepID=UPI00363BE8FA
MRFAPTEEQIAFAEATRSFVSRECRPDVVRAAWATGRTPAALWDGLDGLGLLTLLAPEELGGGGSELELTSAFEELGRAAVPGPVVEHAAVAVPLLAALAPDRLADSTAMSGGLTATVSDVVPYLGAGHALVLESDRIRLVDLNGIEPQESMDSSRAVGRLDRSRLDTAEIVAQGPGVAAHIARAEDRAALMTASFLLGLSARAIEITVEYTSSRRQFGAPVGTFQAVKHHMANAHIAVEMARPVAEAAAWSMATDADDSRRVCSMAKVMANKAARRTAKAALQCHGAIGYTMEADLHLYLMRIWSLLNAWGTTEFHSDRVFDALGDVELDFNPALQASLVG